MDIKDINSSRLLFNIHSPSLIKDISSLISEFNNYKGRIPKTRLFQYIILMYDVNSSMWRSYPAYFTRKFEVARIVGFPIGEDGKYAKNISSMLIGEDKEVNDMVVAYIAQFALPEYVQLVAFQIILYSETKELLAGDIDRDVDKTINRVTDKIRELTRKIFNTGEDDEIVYVRQALYSRAEKDRVMFKPEDVAELLAQGKDLPDDFNPYEKGYKPEKMKFTGDDMDIAERKEYGGL